MAQGTYGELRHSGLDIMSLLRTDEEQDQLSHAGDLEKMSVLSQRTAHSHSSHSSFSSLLPAESIGNANDLPVGASLTFTHLFGPLTWTHLPHSGWNHSVSVCLSVSLPACAARVVSVGGIVQYLSVCLGSICQSICLSSICLFIYLSI